MSSQRGVFAYGFGDPLPQSKTHVLFAVLDCGLRVVNFILCRGGFGWIVSASERVTYLAPHGYLDHTTIVVDYSLGDRKKQGGSPSNSAAMARRKAELPEE